VPGTRNSLPIQARLRFSSTISKEDILECEEIMLESQKHVCMEERKELTDDISSIFGIIKDMCSYRVDGTVQMEVIEKRVLARGHTLDDLTNTLTHYEQMNVLMQNKDGTVTIVV
jgi:DNA replicative helicase MCM subunit Mcm2 (Cdc46/Mcm family)